MTSFSGDPLNAAINDYRNAIDAAIEKKAFGPAIIQIYCCMDLMAYLGIPANKDKVTRGDFIDWASRYIKFKSPEKVTGHELYAARCATVHTYGVRADDTKSGKARHIGYSWGTEAYPEVKFAPGVDPTLVIISVTALRDALFDGISVYLVKLFEDDLKKRTAEKRIRWILAPFHVAGT